MPVKKGFKHTSETRKIYSESKMGIKNPMYGKHHTKERKKQISERHKGKIVSEETRQKIRDALKGRGPPKGRKHTEESKKKMSESRKGIKFSVEHLKNLSISHRGQKVSEEARRKRSEYNKTHPEVIERLRRIRRARPSKPQRELFEIIKALYPAEDVRMEYTVIISKKSRKFIDVAIPRLKIGWEYDSPVYHGLYWGNKEKDLERHNLIEGLGWKLTHYSDVSQFPEKK